MTAPAPWNNGDVVKFVVNRVAGRMNVFINDNRVGPAGLALQPGEYHPFVEMSAPAEVEVLQFD